MLNKGVLGRNANSKQTYDACHKCQRHVESKKHFTRINSVWARTREDDECEKIDCIDFHNT